MNRCAIVSSFYYIENTGFTYNDTPDFLEKVNSRDDNIELCSTDVLTKLLDNINTRLIDRQSLSLEAAVKLAENEEFFTNLDRSELIIFAGSYSSSIYPSAVFNLSTEQNGPNFVNAVEFTNTVGNAAVSRLCIWNQFRGEAHAISEGLNSGLNAIIDAYYNIKNKGAACALACATEEIGSAVVLIQKENIENPQQKPIAYIKDCECKYVGNIDDIQSYFNNLQGNFGINLKDVDIYISGDFDKINNILKHNDAEFEKIVNKNMWSLAPMVDIGRCLYNYRKGSTKDSLIISVDENGFVSSILISGGDI